MAKTGKVVRIIPLVLVLAVVAALAFNRIQDSREANAPPEGSGTVEATEIEVGPQVAGRIDRVLIPEGTFVKAGQVIAVLEDTELKAQFQQARGQRDAALNNYRNVKNGPRKEQIAAARAQLASADAAVAGAVQSLANAERNFRNVTELKQAVTSTDAQIRSLKAQLLAASKQAEAAEAQMKGASETLANAKKALDTVTDLKQAQDLAKGQYESALASRNRASTAMSTARADFERISGLFEQGAVSKRDADNARLALDTARAALDTAEAQVTATKAGYDNARTAFSDRLAAKQAVISATTAYTASLRGREAAYAQVSSVKAQYEGAGLSMNNARTAYADRIQARTARDNAATAVRTSRAARDAARENLTMLEAGNTTEVIETAKGQWQAAEGALALARKKLADSVIKAPTDGQVSTIVARKGEMVSAGLPVVKMLDVRNAYVRVYLPFRSFGKVKIGDIANIDTDAIPKEVFKGKVIAVASEAEFTPKNVQTRDQRLQQVYWVKVAIDDPDGRLKPGMPARAAWNQL